MAVGVAQTVLVPLAAPPTAETSRQKQNSIEMLEWRHIQGRPTLAVVITTEEDAAVEVQTPVPVCTVVAVVVGGDRVVDVETAIGDLVTAIS